jgi:hypothetical protein
MQAIFRAKLHGAELILEADAAHLGAFVFQGAIDVAGLRFVAVGDFPGDPNVSEIASEEVSDLCGQLSDRKGAPFRHQVELKLAHGLSVKKAMCDPSMLRRFSVLPSEALEKAAVVRDALLPEF